MSTYAVTDNNTPQAGRRRANIRLALMLGLVALGFFVLGMYLTAGKAGG